MSKALSKRETRRLKAELRGLLADGCTEDECRDDLGITIGLLRRLKRELLADELEQVVNDSPQEVWAKYRLRMDGCIGDLDDIIRKGSDPKVRGGLSAAVSAVKAKYTIIDNVLKRGQELGVVHKEPAKKVIVAGITVTSAGLEDLRELVESRKEALKGMITKYAPRELVDYADEPDEDLYVTPVAEAIPIRRKVVSE